MSPARLFIRKTMRPEITKRTSDRIYYGQPEAVDAGEEISPYPGLSLKGCSKDGSDGKEGSDGQENCGLQEYLYSFDDLATTRIVDLDARFKPRISVASPARVTFGDTDYNP